MNFFIEINKLDDIVIYNVVRGKDLKLVFASNKFYKAEAICNFLNFDIKGSKEDIAHYLVALGALSESCSDKNSLKLLTRDYLLQKRKQIIED